MGINLTEISQKVLDTVSNASNVFRKMYDLHYNPNPIDVPMEYIDENGQKRTTNVPNVAKFRKRVWDDVGGALGQFDRTFYVDQQNGDDNNEGTRESPFKTLKKAIENVPIGGIGRIRLLSDVTIDTNINVRNQIITIENFAKTLTFHSFYENGVNYVNNITLINSILFVKCKVASPSIANSDSPLDNNYLRGCIQLVDSSVYFDAWMIENAILLPSNAHPLIVVSPRVNQGIGKVNFYNVDILSDGGYLVELHQGATCMFYGNGLSIKDSAGNSKAVTDILAGVVKDTNGIPRNVVSNIVL